MTAPIDTVGLAAPPRSNGQLVFAEPWESRAFGMVISLYEAGVFDWAQFKGALITRIARWEAATTEGGHWNYYQHWLGALEDVLAGSGAVRADDVTARATALAQRATGYDHAH